MAASAEEKQMTLIEAQKDFADADIAEANKLKAMTPAELLRRFELYCEHTKSNPRRVHVFVGKDGDSAYQEKEQCYTMEGFENYLSKNYGIGQIQQYLENRDKRYDDYVDTCNYIKRVIREDMITGGMAGVYHHNLTARLQGITDKVETAGDNIKLMSFDAI